MISVRSPGENEAVVLAKVDTLFCRHSTHNGRLNGTVFQGISSIVVVTTCIFPVSHRWMYPRWKSRVRAYIRLCHPSGCSWLTTSRLGGLTRQKCGVTSRISRNGTGAHRYCHCGGCSRNAKPTTVAVITRPAIPAWGRERRCVCWGAEPSVDTLITRIALVWTWPLVGVSNRGYI